MKRLNQYATGLMACVLASAVFAAAPRAVDTPDKHADEDSEKADSSKFEPFKAEAKLSNGAVTVGGQSIAYQAVAGTLVIHPKGWDDVPRDPKAEKENAGEGEAKNPTAQASMFYVAYFKMAARKGGLLLSSLTEDRAPRPCGCTLGHLDRGAL